MMHVVPVAGRVPYRAGLGWQRVLARARIDGELDHDLVLLLEHAPVVTLGRSSDAMHVVATPEALAAAGVDRVDIERGGDVTYHGPGQVVGYPILDLRPDRCDVHRYVRDLEDVMIRVCGDYGIAAARMPGLTGAWVTTMRGPEKVGAIGVRISRWITSHGFAFNVTTDLEYFRLIVPCGITDGGVTSLAALTGRPISIPDVEEALTRQFYAVFDRQAAVPLAAE